jgi:hypothetical protein
MVLIFVGVAELEPTCQPTEKQQHIFKSTQQVTLYDTLTLDVLIRCVKFKQLN